MIKIGEGLQFSQIFT